LWLPRLVGSNDFPAGWHVRAGDSGTGERVLLARHTAELSAPERHDCHCLDPSRSFRLKIMETRRKLLEEFVAQDPNDSFSRYALALELEKDSAVEEAVAQLKEVISRDAGYVAAYHQLGRLLAQNGFIEDARDIYRRGIDVAKESNDRRSGSEMLEALEMLE
jgi:tetratricopeptide (TPR) repeat protein